MRRLKTGRAAGLLWLLGLAACCLEESPSVLVLSLRMDADLKEACRVSNDDTEVNAGIYALTTYLGHLNYRPSNKQLCTRFFGTACQIDSPCDEQPDLGDCPKPVIPGRRYRPCFGCGAESGVEPYRMRLDPHTYGLLLRVQRESGASTPEEAYHKAVLYYRDLWQKKRQDPNFYKNPYNLPHIRKPDEPCPRGAELSQRLRQWDARRQDGGVTQSERE